MDGQWDFPGIINSVRTGINDRRILQCQGAAIPFDIVIARAVAKLSVLSEYCLPLTKIGGTFIALKGNMLENEIKDAQNALEKLGGSIKNINSLELPIEKSTRKIVVMKKNKSTPKKFPRKAGTVTKNPL